MIGKLDVDATVFLMHLCVHSVIAMMSPEDSWVAKWQRIGKDVCLTKRNSS